MNTKLFALMATVGLLLFAFGPAVGTAAAGNDSTTGNDGTAVGNEGLVVSVANAGNDGATVTVTDDGEAVEGAGVTVDATDGNVYVGEGEYTTGADGTVDLPEPNFDVEVNVTATNGTDSATATANLTSEADQSFGMSVSGFVQDMLSKSGADGHLGFYVATFVTQNNPGNAPDHAGPPEDKGPDAQSEQGAPEDKANAQEDKRRGPPEDKGPNKDADAQDEETAESEETEEEEETETEDEAETEEGTETDEEDDEEDDTEDDDGERGPPDHANGGNGNGN